MTDITPWENEPPTPTPSGINLTAWAQEFRDVYRISEALCKTPFVPREMIGHQAEVAAAIMKGKELGLDPFDALGSIYIVHGRVGYYAEFLRRRIIQAGHIFKIIETTDTRCIVEGVRKDSGQSHRASFTTEQARKAGIDLGKYPADKLIARATSRLCKQAFPDVLSGSLIAEDLIDGLIPPTDEETTPTPAEPGPPVQRKRKPPAPKAARTQPKTTPKPAPAKAETDEIAELLGDTPTPAGADAPVPSDPPAPAQTPECPHGPEQTCADYENEKARTELAADDESPPEPDEPITKPQNRKLHALMRELGITEQADRHIIRDHILGYHPETDLTKTEANRLIDTAETWLTDTEYAGVDRVNDILNEAALAEAEAAQDDS